MDVVTVLPSLAKGMIDDVTCRIELTVGKGPLYLHLPSCVPTHPCRVLGAATRGSSLGNVWQLTKTRIGPERQHEWTAKQQLLSVSRGE